MRRISSRSTCQLPFVELHVRMSGTTNDLSPWPQVSDMFVVVERKGDMNLVFKCILCPFLVQRRRTEICTSRYVLICLRTVILGRWMYPYHYGCSSAFSITNAYKDNNTSVLLSRATQSNVSSPSRGESDNERSNQDGIDDYFSFAVPVVEDSSNEVVSCPSNASLSVLAAHPVIRRVFLRYNTALPSCAYRTCHQRGRGYPDAQAR